MILGEECIGDDFVEECIGDEFSRGMHWRRF